MARKGRQQSRRPTRGLSRKTLVGLAAVLALAAAGILALVSLAGTPASPPSAASSVPAQGSTKGSPEAKVTVVEYSDFQCPYCARFALDTFPRLEEAYVKTGKVRWVFRHFAFLGQESILAAQAAECAGEQGHFWPYHDKLFASQGGENRGAFSLSRLKALARQLGLKGETFDACLDSGRQAGKVRADTQEGQRQGVRATPTFFVEGKKLEGAQPYSAFGAAIEEALAP